MIIQPCPRSQLLDLLVAFCLKSAHQSHQLIATTSFTHEVHAQSGVGSNSYDWIQGDRSVYLFAWAADSQATAGSLAAAKALPVVVACSPDAPSSPGS